MPESAYPELFEGLDASTRKVVKLSLGRPAPGQLPSREEVADLIDRVLGRITFEEYLRRRRRRQTAGDA